MSQAYNDQIIIALKLNTELVQYFFTFLPYYDLLLSHAVSNRINNSKAHGALNGFITENYSS